jgi:hypothetical protein
MNPRRVKLAYTRFRKVRERRLIPKVQMAEILTTVLSMLYSAIFPYFFTLGRNSGASPIPTRFGLGFTTEVNGFYAGILPLLASMGISI